MRYGVSVAVRSAGTALPWATAACNLVGCFLAGLVYSVARSRMVSDDLRLVLLVGFLGSFTTFSALLLDGTVMLQRAEVWAAALNLGGQLVLGLVLVALGMAVGRSL